MYVSARRVPPGVPSTPSRPGALEWSVDAPSDRSPAPALAAAWTCGACGYANDDAALCARCGVSRAWLEDRPLDLPPVPGPFERPATWLALLHAGLAGLGVLLLVRPEVAPFLALTPPVQAGQVALSLAAAWSSLNRAAIERTFRLVELHAPDRAPANEPLTVRASLVPYRRVRGAHVELALISNTYTERRRRREFGVGTRSRVLARHRMLAGETVRGRRETTLEARFVAPYPTPDHRDPTADFEASLLGAFAWLVPGLGEVARNLREHGGIWVRLVVRVGPWRHRVERRVFVYHLGGGRIDIA